MINKGIILICCVNIISLIGLLCFWSSSVETYIGGVCNYWRCVNSDIMLLPIYLSLILIFNSVSIILYIVYNIGYRELKKYDLER
jgi:hypothetical protein